MVQSSTASIRVRNAVTLTPAPTKHLQIVRSPSEQERVRKLFDYLGERGNSGGTVRYDCHMGSDTNHYQRMKASIDLLAPILLHRRLKRASEIRIISVGGGTGEIESHFVRNCILPHLRANTDIKMTLVLVDDALNMIATANEKFESLKMQANGVAKRLKFIVVPSSAENLTPKNRTDINPEFQVPFDIAICSYVSAWFASRHLAYGNVRNLLLNRKGRLLTMEEHELNFTPSTSMPEDSDFAKLIREVAQKSHIHPRELYKLLEDIGFGKGWKLKPAVPIDVKPEHGAKEHSLYTAVKPANGKPIPELETT
ncbi:MAG: hypothetical protein Q7S22_06510 [Candidatus Micrarchaeota archaeon]|nr:hypothetical protein [Candidatus Micrarchaeota archaeon]